MSTRDGARPVIRHVQLHITSGWRDDARRPIIYHERRATSGALRFKSCLSALREAFRIA